MIVILLAAAMTIAMLIATAVTLVNEADRVRKPANMDVGGRRPTPIRW